MKLIDLDEAIDAIESTDWYHINNRGELSEGAEGDESALYKATDIYKAIKELLVVDAEPVIRCMDCKWFGAWYCDLLHFGIVDLHKYCAWAESKEE